MKSGLREIILKEVEVLTHLLKIARKKEVKKEIKVLYLDFCVISSHFLETVIFFSIEVKTTWSAVLFDI